MKTKILLTVLNIPAIGDTFKVIGIDTTGLYSIYLPWSGPNVTWDFSQIDSINYYDRIGLNPSVTPYNSIYPNANFCEKQIKGTSTMYAYSVVTNTEITAVGVSGTGLDSTIYSNYDTVMTFPYTYLDTVNDTTISKIYLSVGAKMHHYIGRHSVADAYGTLIMPDSTYNNVLRYKTTSYSTDSAFFGAMLISVDNFYWVYYTWISSDYRPYLLDIEAISLKN
ncbi:MAG: hypothetical protein HY738_02585, partial [Bacteroidia bacterium]|nr:hypothetical protein [Bacteroidia bacterium]